MIADVISSVHLVDYGFEWPHIDCDNMNCVSGRNASILVTTMVNGEKGINPAWICKDCCVSHPVTGVLLSSLEERRLYKPDFSVLEVDVVDMGEWGK